MKIHSKPGDHRVLDRGIDSVIKEPAGERRRIRIVTWQPDSYGFSDSAYWKALQERMRSNGFEMNLTEDCCQHYCIVDREF